MPPVNQAALSAGVIAVSVAVAAAIAVYESPELRRMADDLRRRIAIALHSLGDNIEPRQREPLFNRPEDAEGFMQSRAEPSVDADEETKRRQREELMYWNSVRLQKKEEQEGRDVVKREAEEELRLRGSTHGSTFDDFLQRDKMAGEGTYVFNTGADPRQDDDGLLRRRGPEGVRGLNSWLPVNPFADENGIELDEQHPIMETNIMSPGRDEMSDIYNATEPASPVQPPVFGSPSASATVFPASADHNIASILFDAAVHLEQQTQQSDASNTLERELGPDEYMTAGQERGEEDDMNRDAYASIQAWAQNNSSPGFYSPLPNSPAAPLSEPELISEGALTPTDSMSVISSGEDFGGRDRDAASAAGGQQATTYYDVISEDEEGDGVATPVSWSEVGSVVSENEAGPVRA